MNIFCFAWESRGLPAERERERERGGGGGWREGGREGGRERERLKRGEGEKDRVVEEIKGENTNMTSL